MRKVIKFILIIICMITIFSFSSDNGSKSTKKSDGVIIKYISLIKNGNVSDKEKLFYTEKFVVPVRKSAHFIIYFILGLLITSFLSEFDFIDKRIILYSVICCFLYASSDEIHQLFVSGRSGMIRDVLLDSLGSSLACFIYMYIKNKFCKTTKISYNK